jgi:hypothetical protein
MMRALVLFTALVGTFASQQFLERTRVDPRLEKARLAAFSGSRLRHLFAGFELAGADLFWLRAVQHYGGERAFSPVKEFELVDPLIENVITLDRHFSIAYSLGATFLAEPPPLGQGRPQAAVRLLDRGTEALPTDWFLWRDAALFRANYLGDGVGAVERLRRASALEGSPFWLKTLAADLAQKGGAAQVSRQIWESLSQSDLPFVRENARRNLRRMEALDLAERVQVVVDRYKAVHGKPPASWGEVVAAGLLDAPPKDSSGVELSLDDGRVGVARASFLWRPGFDAQVR